MILQNGADSVLHILLSVDICELQASVAGKIVLSSWLFNSFTLKAS